MSGDVVRIRYGIAVNYIAGSTREDYEEIDREEWDAMDEVEQQAMLDSIAAIQIENQVDTWAYVEDE